MITRNSFQPSPSPPPQTALTVEPIPITEINSLDNDPTNQKGFYISFDDDQPKRPKPPLRMKRASPKKERSYIESPEETHERKMVMIYSYYHSIPIRFIAEFDTNLHVKISH